MNNSNGIIVYTQNNHGMNSREYLQVLEKHKELKKEISLLLGGNINNEMKIHLCTGITTKPSFNLKELNRELIKNIQ